jgi:hypothetical protein
MEASPGSGGALLVSQKLMLAGIVRLAGAKTMRRRKAGQLLVEKVAAGNRSP